MKNAMRFLRLHLPYVIGIVLILANVLIDQNIIHLSDQATNVVNAVLAAFGLGVLHRRQA